MSHLRNRVLGVAAGVLLVGAAVMVARGRMDGSPGTRPRNTPESEPSQAEAPPPPSPMAATTPSLLSLVPTDTGCRWEVRRPPDSTPNHLRVTERCPDDILWMGTPDAGETIVKYGGQLFRIGTSGVEVAIPPPQGPGTGGWIMHVWVAEATERLRIGYIAAIPCVREEDRCTYDVGGRVIGSVREDDGWERYGMEDGWATPNATGQGRRSLPPWGVEGVALAYEADGIGDWTLVAAAPTRAEAGDTPGLDVLDLTPASGTASLSDLRIAGTCQELMRASTGCHEHDGTLPDSVSAQLDPEYFETRALPFGTTTLVFPVIYGDGPHIMSPVFIDCEPGCAPTPLSLPTDARQLSMDVRGQFLLVTRAYAMDQAHVFAPGSPDPVLRLPPTAVTAWLPR